MVIRRAYAHAIQIVSVLALQAALISVAGPTARADCADLVWSSYIGGLQGQSSVADVVPDFSGNIWVAGSTSSADFPTPGGFQTTGPGFAAMIDASRNLAYATRLSDAPSYIAVDGSGHVWLTGKLGNGMHVSRFLPSDGRAPVTLFSFPNVNTICGIVADAAGNAYVCGETSDRSFPASASFGSVPNWSRVYCGRFLMKLNPFGDVAWCRWLGDCDGDSPRSIAMDGSGRVYVCGQTYTWLDAPAPSWSICNTRKPFATRIGPSGSLAWVTYLDTGMKARGIAGDRAGNIVVAGEPGKILRLAGDGQILWRSYLAIQADKQYLVGLAAAGDTWYTAVTSSPDWVTDDGFSTAIPESSVEGFAARFDQSGQRNWGSFLGGGQDDYPTCMRIDANDSIWIGGSTASWTFPCQKGFQQARANSGPTGFIMELKTNFLEITTESLPDGMVGASYSGTLAARMSSPPPYWAVTSGDLPTGLSLNAATGAISGTPTEMGTRRFEVTLIGGGVRLHTVKKSLAIRVLGGDVGPIVSTPVVVPNVIREKLDTSLCVTCSANSVRDGLRTISSVQYSVGTSTGHGVWMQMEPSDGAFDSQIESAWTTIDTSLWRIVDGPRTIYVRAVDSDNQPSVNIESVTVDVIDGLPPGRVFTLSLTPAADLETIHTDTWETPGKAVPMRETKMIDLGRLRNVGGIGLMPSSIALFPRRLSMEVSPDGMEWTTIATHVDYRAVRGVNVWQFDPGSYRYVRLIATTVYNPAVQCYQTNVPRINVLSRVDGGKLKARWMESANDGYDKLSGWAAKSDLRYSPSPITESSFQSCRKVEGVSAPGKPASFAETVFSTGDAEGTIHCAVKVSDDAGNDSPLSNVESAKVTYMGLSSQGENDFLVTTPDLPPQLVISRGRDVKAAFIAFSSSVAFPRSPIANPDGSVTRTIKFPIRVGRYAWEPSEGQWKAIRSVASTLGVIYWRLEGRSASCPSLVLAPKELFLGTGEITHTDVDPLHSGRFIFPDASQLPVFSWSCNIPGMTYFWVDISGNGVFSSKGSSRVVSIPAGTAWSVTASKARWKAIRSLAAASGGALYVRVRAKDRDRMLTLANESRELFMDGGTWTLSDVASTPEGPMISWQHQGEGIAAYRLEFSATEAFGSKPGTTVAVPSTSISATSYTLKATEIARLRTLAARAGATTLRYRIRGEDAERAFRTYSEAKTMSVP